MNEHMRNKLKKTESLAELINALVNEALERAKVPSLGTPALAVHTLLKFAQLDLDAFLGFVNDGVTKEGLDAIDRDFLESRLDLLHEVVDAAVAAEDDDEIPPFVHVRITRM